MMNRRKFLRNLGIGGTGLGLGTMGLGTLGWRSALANTEEAPKRMILLNHNHGWVYDGWKIHPENMSTSNDWALDLSALGLDQFSPSLAP